MPHDTRGPEHDEHLIRAHALVIDVLDSLLVSEGAALDQAIDGALARIGAFAGVDRAYVFQMRDCGTLFDNTHEWAAPGIAPMLEELQAQPVDLIRPWLDDLRRGCEIQISDVAAMPETHPLRPSLLAQRIRSLVVVPMLQGSRVTGLVGLDAVRQPRVFSETETRLLGSVARALSVRITRREARRAAVLAQMQEREARSRLEATLGALPGLILELDAAGRYVDVHTNEPDLLVNPADHFLGRLTEEADPPELARMVRGCMAEVEATGKPAHRVYPLDVAGGRKWFDATMVRKGNGEGGRRDGYVVAVRDVTRERERDAQIRQLSYLAQQTTNLVAITDRDQRIDWVNPAFERRSGYRLAEARGKTVPELLHCPETDQAAVAAVHTALDRGEAARAELLYRAKSGERYWVELDIQQLFDESGEVVAYYSIQTDITERKRQEAELAELARTAEEARDRLHAAVDALPDAFAYFDRDDRLVVCNEGYRQFYARSAGAIRPGATFEDVLRAGLANGEYPDAAGREADWLRERLAEHRQPRSVHESRLGDGRWLRVIEQETPDGGRVGMRIDITDAREAERRLADIIEGANAGTWTYDVGTGIETHNERWFDLIGYAPGEIDDRTVDVVETFGHPDDLEELDRRMDRVLSGESADFEHELRFRHKRGHWVWLLSRGRVSRRDAEGRPVELAGVNIDISRIKEAEERLDQIITGAEVGTWELDVPGGLIRVNEIWARMVGYDPDEIDPIDTARLQAFIHPEDYAAAMAGVAATLTGEAGMFQSEFRLRHKEGHWVWVASRGQIVRRTAEGEPLVLAGVMLDVSRIKAAEERLDDIIDGARAGTWEWDVPTGENRHNKRWAEIIGYSNAELGSVGIDLWRSLLHPDDLPRIDAELDRVFRREAQEFEYEFRMRHKDGHWVWVLSRGRVARWSDDGSPLLMVGVHLDISRMKAAEQRVEEIVEGAQVGTWEVDIRTGRNAINSRWAQMIGYAPEELGAVNLQTFRDLVHPDDFRAMMRQHKERLTRDGIDDFENEIRMRHKAGHWVWVLSRGRVTRRDADGAPLVTAGVHIDITRGKELEAALQAERDFLGQLMETSVSAIVALDDDGEIIFSNSEAERVLGLRPSEIAGRRFDDPDWRITALDGGPFPIADLPFNRVMATGKPVHDLRHAIEWPDGRRQLLSINAALIEAPDSAARVVCSVSDITAQLQAEEALRAAVARAEAANQAKSRFLANMSHEIRTPLNGVLGMAEVLDQSLNDPANREMIKVIRDSGEVLLNVLNDILDMSKIEAGKLGLEAAPFNPTELADRVEALYRLKAEAKGLDFSVPTDCGSRDARIGDQNRILQILNNLIGNALKFTQQGEISVSFRCRPGEPVRIRVRDDGIGMTPEQAARVFEDFEQADGTVTRRFGGTGLGLSIVRRLAELMGGQISLESAPGRGTTVDVFLPLEMAEPAAPTDTPPAPPADPPVSPAAPDIAGLRGLRALVADDNATNRMILEAMLSGYGIDTVIVEDGREAVEGWQPGAFDIVLLDISMPGMDGLTALAHLRARMADAGEGHVPILAITANAMTHQVREYLAAGFDGHIGKPVRLDRLGQAIARAVGEPAPG